MEMVGKMKKILLIASSIALALTSSCSDPLKNEQNHKKGDSLKSSELDTAITADVRDGWQWPASEVAALTKRAESGDMGAADSLLQYYSVQEDESKIAYWEDWLFKRGNPNAIQLRAEQIWWTAHKRADDDPRKLAELREAERLLASAQSESVNDPFLDRLRLEIATLESSK
jgi:hypothetical protein